MDEYEVRTLQPRVEFHENDIEFMKFHTSAASDLKSGKSDRERNFDNVVSLVPGNGPGRPLFLRLFLRSRSGG